MDSPSVSNLGGSPGLGAFEPVSLPSGVAAVSPTQSQSTWIGIGKSSRTNCLVVVASAATACKASIGTQISGITGVGTSAFVASTPASSASKSASPTLGGSPISPQGQSPASSVLLKSYNEQTGALQLSTPITNLIPGSKALIASSNGAVILLGQPTSGSTNTGPVTIADVFSGTTGRLQHTLTLPGQATSVFGGQRHLYAATTTQTSKNSPVEHLVTIDSTSGVAHGDVQVPIGFVPEAKFGQTLRGVDAGTGQIIGIDPTSGDAINTVVLSHNGSVVSAFSVAFFNGDLWANAASAPSSSKTLGLLFELSPTSGAILGVNQEPSPPEPSTTSLTASSTGLLLRTQAGSWLEAK
ncbi:MAG: hypothetical protein ACYDHP_08370 [Ferrimicrobium sp.]